MPVLLLPLLLLFAACGEDAAEPGVSLGSCFSNADCPDGLDCKAGVCVARDGLPPEVVLPASTFLTPVASRAHLWIPSSDGSTVTAVHASTLELRSFSVPEEPVAVAALPGEDAALVLSREGASLTRIAFESEGIQVDRYRIERKLSAITLSADGKWAVLWNPDGSPLDSGLEGLVFFVDLDALARGELIVHERMAGRRLADVFFREAEGAAVDVVIVAKDDVTIFDLGGLDDASSWERLALPDPLAEPTIRRVVGTDDGAFLLLGSATSPELLAVDVEDRSLHPLVLPGAPSDLRGQGESVVAVLREVGMVSWFPFPAVLDDPGLVQEAEVVLSWEGCEEEPCTAAPGQARFSPEGDAAHLFTTASPALVFATLDLEAGTWTLSPPLRKPLRTLSPGLVGDRLLLIHQRTDSTRADPYEKQVDESEGYGIADLRTGAIQLRLTDQVLPLGVVHAEGGKFASVLLRDDRNARYQVDAIDLETLVPTALDLPSPPVAAGPLSEDGKIWVLQEHSLGRISFVDLSERRLETITGFALQGRVQ